MSLQESGEMYLETIYVLSQKKSPVRSIDIADEMGFSKPSVCRAVSLLKTGEYISVDDDGYITLTQVGLETATKIYERHVYLTEALKRMGVDEETARNDACRIEHVISDETFNAVKKYFNNKK